MPDKSNFSFYDILIIVLKYKKSLAIITLTTFIISYLAIYIFITPQYDSSALIVPSGQSSLTGFSSIVKNLKELPFGLGGSSSTDETDLYKTIIYSRTNLENMISRFNLKADYNLESLDKAVKTLEDKITAEDTKDNSFIVKIRANSPQKAANMVNYLLDYLNKKVIELNVTKSKENSEFLGQRYKEVTEKLQIAQDSLQMYQQKSGMFEPEAQLKLILTAYSDLEAKVMAKKVEYEYMTKILAKDSPALSRLETQLKALEEQLKDVKKEGIKNSIFLPYSSLPKEAKIYGRLYQNVKIYQTILEYLVPVYEQTKFEEQKDVPVLQIIDRGNIPEKKSFPPRVLFAAIITIVLGGLVIFMIVVREIFRNSQNPKLLRIKEEASFSKKEI